MNLVIQIIIDALSVGSLYAMSALGIGLIFGIMRLMNFAHGEFIMIGAYSLLLTAAQWAPVRVMVSVMVVIAVALATERIAFRPVRRANPTTLLITSFAVSFFLQYLFVLLLGARPIGIDILPSLGEPFTVGAVRIPRLHVVTIGLTAVLLAAIALFLKRTHFGIEMRAAAINFRMARLLGVRANRVIAVAFALSGFLAAVISMLYVVQTGTLSPTMGLQLALFGFIATIIGGMGSLVGAVLGGMFVGAVSVLLQSTLPVELRPYRDAFVFAVVFFVILARPQGLFRGAEARERV